MCMNPPVHGAATDLQVRRYFVQAALNRDYTLVMGVTVFYGVLIILANLAVDLIYGLLDPRIRYD